MRIEDLPHKLSLKRSIAVCMALVFIAGLSLGFGLGMENMSNILDEGMQKAANDSLKHPFALILFEGHYYRFVEVNYTTIAQKELDYRQEAYNDTFNKTT